MTSYLTWKYISILTEEKQMCHEVYSFGFFWGGGGGGGKIMYSVVAFGDFGKVYTLYLISYIVSYFYMCKNLTKTMNIY